MLPMEVGKKCTQCEQVQWPGIRCKVCRAVDVDYKLTHLLSFYLHVKQMGEWLYLIVEPTMVLGYMRHAHSSQDCMHWLQHAHSVHATCTLLTGQHALATACSFYIYCFFFRRIVYVNKQQSTHTAETFSMTEQFLGTN